MNIITGIIRLGIAVVALLFCYKSLSDHFGGNEKKLAKWEELSTSGATTMAVLDDEYTEIEVYDVKSYTIDYTYQVDGKDYKGLWAFGHPSEITNQSMEITYNPKDPNISAVDVDKEIEKMEKKLSGKGGLIFGIIAGLFGLLMLGSSIGKFKSNPSQA